MGLRTVYGPLRAGENVFGGFDYELPVKPATAHRLTYFPHYLIVHAWGFSAYFVTLTEDYQADIIARTAHGL